MLGNCNSLRLRTQLAPSRSSGDAIVLRRPGWAIVSKGVAKLSKNWQVILMALACAAAVAEPEPGLVLEKAWVRALPPTQANTAAYLVLSNRGQVELTVVGGSAALAERLEIHTTREIDGYMRMEQLDQLRLGPGETLRLEPGGTHLMLLGLERMPAVDESVRLCLDLAAGGEVCTEAPVRKSESGGATHHHHHQQE